MITRLSLVLGLGLVPLAAQSVNAPNANPRQTRVVERMATYLKLSESQKVQIQAIQARHADTVKPLIQAAVEAHKAFREVLRNPDATAAQLKPLYQAQSDKDFELMLERRAMHNEIRAVLTPEQRAEMDKFQAFRQGFKQGRLEHREGMGF